jgi:cysteine-rich repeat protein
MADSANCKGLLRWACMMVVAETINARAGRCKALQKSLSDQSMGINARIPEAQTEAVEVNGVEIDKFAYASLDFVPLNTKRIKWRTVALRPNKKLPKALFGGATLSFSSAKKTFVNGASGIDIVNGLVIVNDFKKDALIMDGCALPIFDFKVAWRKTGDCWSRTISVKFSASAGTCVHRFSSNNVRTYNTHAAAMNFIQSHDWAESGVKYPRGYAELIFKCAQDGKWSGQSSNAPGSCATCASVTAKQDGVVVISCNRTLPHQPDCCVGCNPTTHMAMPSAELKCVSKCAPGYSVSAQGRCSQCPFGQASMGGLAPCLSCATLLGDPNSVFSGGQCLACGALASAVSTTTCANCPVGKHVPRGSSTCVTCALQGHFVSARGACVPCVPGTYFSRAQGECLICPSNTVAPNNGSTACMDCAVGHVSSLFTKCVQCPAINASVMPFAQYYQRGCNIRCAPGISYVRTSPYIRNGCASCASVVAPVGTFISATDCTITRPCTSAPRDRAYYTTNGTRADNCEWKCNVGFQRVSSTCEPCNFGSRFSPLKHVAIENCKYTCRPGLYVDLPNLFCNISCVNLLDEVSAGRIKPRVRDYGALSRPSYVHGMCGTNETLPRSTVIFLRFGRWAYISSAAARCGNSLLNTNEDCDDGNTVSGDGCSSNCRIELSSSNKWECDVIGAPCVRNCGWTFKSPTPNGVGLIGFYLPPDATGCGNLSYRYNVEPLSPYARAEWMKNNLLRCDACGATTLPFSECNSTNRGCRECSSGQFHDDIAGKCVMCGSSCAPGYTRTSCSTAYPTGCTPCQPHTLPVRFIQGCAYACLSGISYCTTIPKNGTGICTSACSSCEQALSLLINTKHTFYSAGYYPKGCSSEANGYEWAPCAATSKPAGAIWISNSESDANGCRWKCASESHVEWRGTCVPTFKFTAGQVPPCVPGQRLQWSSTAIDQAVCLPCVGALPGTYQIWTSEPPSFSTCVPACSPSVSYRLSPDAPDCAPCSNPQCVSGEYLSACNLTSDAACLPCAAVLSPVLEYVAPGECKTRCIAGYFLDFSWSRNGECVKCERLPSCPMGKYRATPCDAACSECSDVPNLQQPNTVWTDAACSFKCAPGFIMLPATQACQLCDPSVLCQHGGECTWESVICYDAPPAEPPAEPPTTAPAASASTITMGGVARPDLKYPTRGKVSAPL